MEHERYFSNPHHSHPTCLASRKEASTAEVDFARSVSVCTSHLAQKVPPELAFSLLKSLEETVAQCDSAYRHAPSSDTCVYTGTAGIALLHLHLATTLYASNQQKSREHLLQAQSLLAPCLSRLPSRQLSFLCGAGGPLAIAAVVEAGLGHNDIAKVSKGEVCWSVHDIVVC